MQIDKRFKDSLNFRDLAGLKTSDGRFIKEGYFYRGAGLSFFDDEELKSFEDIGIKIIMDLRSPMEISQYPDPEIKGARRIEYSGFVVDGSKPIDWSPAGMKRIGGEAKEQLDKIHHYYTLIAFNNNAFRIMIDEILKGDLPLYFHCATGKDRTGVAAMVIEMLLGVSKEEMKKDYLLSNEFRKHIIKDSLDSVAHIAKDNPEINTLIRMQDGVVEKIFEIVTDSIEAKYDSYDEYIMKEFDISEDQMKAIRDKYLCEK